MTMSLPRRASTALSITAAVVALTILVAASSAAALDVRQSDGDIGTLYSELVRAYVPCTAPNTATNSGGQPACAPPVTSACNFPDGSWLRIHGLDDFLPNIGVSLKPSGAPVCLEDTGVIALGLRGTGDYTSDPLEAPCPTGRCTYPDVLNHFDLKFGGGNAFIGQLDLVNGNFEFLGLTVTAPDGLPIAAPGVGRVAPAAERFVSNLTVPTPPCLGTEPCDLPPWTSPCDFESGEVEWTLDASSAPRAHVTLRKVAGTSPLCTTGPYAMEALVRATVKGCGGTFQNPGTCTLVDQTVTLPLEVRGRDVNDGGLVHVGGYAGIYEATQIIAVRILDPTGTPVAAAGVTGVFPLGSPRITIKGDALRIKALFPTVGDGLDVGGIDIDPAVDPGLTITLLDRNGPIYAVNISEERWQLQPPLGSRWDYVDQSGILNGVRLARVKRVAKRGVRLGYAIDLRVQGVDLSAADLSSVTLKVDVHRFAANFDDVFQMQGTRTCRGTYPKLTCK